MPFVKIGGRHHAIATGRKVPRKPDGKTTAILHLQQAAR
jgi:hypothetical protein